MQVLMVLVVIARVIGVSACGGLLGVGLACLLFGGQERDCILACLILGCVGGLIGALAGTAGEIVLALRRRPTN